MKNIRKTVEESKVSQEKKDRWRRLFLTRIFHKQGIRLKLQTAEMEASLSSEIDFNYQAEKQSENSGLNYLEFEFDSE